MPKILATDLDGTLVPRPGDEANRRDLQTLRELLTANHVELLFVTGRHLSSIERAIAEEGLPVPNWIIGDVGTTLYQRTESGSYETFMPYYDHLTEVMGEFPLETLQERTASIPGMRLQEPEKLSRFKLSFYTDADALPSLVERFEAMIRDENLACELIHSIDPHDDGGLIDFLPKNASKAYALEWWCQQQGHTAEEVLFSGDSGNDLAAFLAGHRAIVVHNTQPPIPRDVFDFHRKQGWRNRFYHSDAPGTSGVLEGCHYFGLFERKDKAPAEPSWTGAAAPNKNSDQRKGEAPAEPQSYHNHPRLRLGGSLALPTGATPVSVNQTFFRVWAPKSKTVHVQVHTDNGTIRQEMTPTENGFHEAIVNNVSPGDQYYYEVQNRVLRPDPLSYAQPQGVHKQSAIVDHHTFPWQDDDWQGVAKKDLVIYELHVGTFTEAGTYQGVIDRLDYLLELGVTAIELMPVAQAPGRWNWGYDGVNIYAPNHNYGTPDDLKALIDACHRRGLAVLLDVVYNHLGPEGNYLADFGQYFSRRHHTPWGSAFNLDGPRRTRPVRSYLIDNAIFWLREYHFDGLRLDAIHYIHDISSPHITEELAQAVAEFKKTTDREIHLIAESNVFDETLIGLKKPDEPTSNESAPYDACWCDDLMYSLYSLVVPKMMLPNRGYHGTADFTESLEHGYLYIHRGNLEEYTRVTDDVRQTLHAGRSADYLSSLVVGLQTHDAVGNHPQGKRLHQLASIELQKAAAALALLYPTIPILFMGEEFSTDAPFPFFTDFTDERLRRAVDRGRKREFKDHNWSVSLLPCQEETFQAAKLRDMPTKEEAQENSTFAWYRSLLKLRREGIEQGWLCPANLKITADQDQSTYTMEYKDQTKTYLTVVAQLGNETEPSVSVKK